ncbi:hypothetical protein MG293_018232 [Ovis ammon polii]|uniref:Uncharacterized protein n=1 Tax=Ovis ammon polii TaxID=230172 RepID=A0AAD4Y1Y4_OVIAM|nr:hypothetical protein MG293_018232 [Ovis ammon polii]
MAENVKRETRTYDTKCLVHHRYTSISHTIVFAYLLTPNITADCKLLTSVLQVYNESGPVHVVRSSRSSGKKISSDDKVSYGMYSDEEAWGVVSGDQDNLEAWPPRCRIEMGCGVSSYLSDTAFERAETEKSCF